MQTDSQPTGPVRKPGNRFYRVPRIEPLRVIVPIIRPFRPTTISLLTVAYGFAIVIAVGSLLLMSPYASRSGGWTPFIDALFTSTSAVCVTGLVVVDTYDHWTLFGQIVILVLIQFGGLGFMTVATLFLMAAGRRIGLRGRLLMSEALGVSHAGGVVRLTRNIIIFSVAVEIMGAAIFYSRFGGEFGQAEGAWKSVFQAVSAFNNAGFDVFGGFRSVSQYSESTLVLLTTAGLVIVGGVSFIALHDIFRARGLRRTLVDTRLILLVTLILLGLGTLGILGTEYANSATIGPMPIQLKILNAFFQSVTSRTAGFASFATGSMVLFTLFLTMLLMFVGGAAGSTAGGIKVNTVGIMLATIWNTIRGVEHPGAFGREFNIQQVLRAFALLVLGLLIILVIFLILSFTDSEFPSVNVLFETVSAFGTVGLSTGITPDLSVAGKAMIIITMFIGRLGPLTLTFALVKAQRATLIRYPEETIRVG